jgi:hypothetical protein
MNRGRKRKERREDKRIKKEENGARRKRCKDRGERQMRSLKGRLPVQYPQGRSQE